MSTFQMPFYFIKTVSQAEKDAWMYKALRDSISPYYEGNQISARFEPIKGWRPFEKYGENPIQIIHNCIKDCDNTIGKILFLRDRVGYIDDTLFVVSGRNFHSDRNPENILIAPGCVCKERSAYNIINKEIEYPDTMLSDSYDNFYKRFPSDVKQYILNMKLPYRTTKGRIREMNAHVFPPADDELKPHGNSIRPMFSRFPFDIYAPDSLEFWTRNSHNNATVGQCVAIVDERAGIILASSRIDIDYPMFPCFCIG